MGKRLTGAIYATHSWTGLIFGWLLFVICVTGTLVVYKFELKAWINPALSETRAADPLGPDRALAALRAHAPDVKVTLFAFPNDNFSIHNYTLDAKDAEGRRFRYWLNPANGRIHKGLQSDFADFVQRLHAGLFMGKTGRWVVGALGVAMALSMVTGLAFHWKKLRRDLFRLRLGSHPRQAFSDLHKAVGVWLLPVHIVVTLTGAWLGLETLLIAGNPPPFELKGSGAGPPASVAKLVDAAEARLPQMTATHMTFANHGAAGSTVRVQGAEPGMRLIQYGKARVFLDAQTATALQSTEGLDEGLGERLLILMRPLHYGYFGGELTKALYFAAGLGSCLMVLSGLLVWAERDRRRRFASDPRAITGLERANAAIAGGFLVALSLAFCLSMVALKATDAFGLLGGLHYLKSQDILAGRPITPELPAFFALWAVIGLGLAPLKPGRAWKVVLGAVAGLSLLLPLASAWVVGGFHSDWTRGVGESAGVTVVCGLLSSAALLTLRRLARGPAAATSTPRGG